MLYPQALKVGDKIGVQVPRVEIDNARKAWIKMERNERAQVRFMVSYEIKKNSKVVMNSL